MKRSSKMLIGGVAVLGLVGAALAADAEGPAVRAGVRRVGDCEDFETVDPDALSEYAESVVEALAAGQSQVTPEVLLTSVYGSLFPECPWPPRPGTAARDQWDTAVAAMGAVVDLVSYLQALGTPGFEQGPDAPIPTEALQQAAASIAGVFR